MASITETGRRYAEASPRSWRRAFVTSSGFAFLALGAWLAAVLATHDAGDPSWNQSINATAKNLMGLPGARISDLMLQWLGLAAWLLPAVLIDWALRFISGKGLTRFWLKALVLPALLFAALRPRTKRSPGSSPTPRGCSSRPPPRCRSAGGFRMAWWCRLLWAAA